MDVGGQGHTPAALPRQRYPVSIVQLAGWVTGPVWKGYGGEKILLLPSGFEPGILQHLATALPRSLSRRSENWKFRKEIFKQFLRLLQTFLIPRHQQKLFLRRTLVCKAGDVSESRARPTSYDLQ